MCDRINVQNNPVNYIDPLGLAWITVNAKARGDHSTTGHGWITIINDNGTQETLGHYPDNLAYGPIDRDKTERPSNSFNFEITQDQADAARKAADVHAPYDIFGRNCADLVERALDASNVAHPNFDTFGVSDPNKIYDWINGNRSRGATP
jgi:hypothetical protein